MNACHGASGGRWRTPGRERAVDALAWSLEWCLISRIRDAGFGVFITVDKGIPFQQNLRELPSAIIVLRAHTNDAGVLMQFVARVREALTTIAPGAVIVINE